MDTPGTLETSVAAALTRTGVDPRDQATADLATTYARAIDGNGDLAKLGPALLAALAALGMTPAARHALMKGGDGGPAGSPLDELRARRAARTNPSAAVDATAP